MSTYLSFLVEFLKAPPPLEMWDSPGCAAEWLWNGVPGFSSSSWLVPGPRDKWSGGEDQAAKNGNVVLKKQSVVGVCLGFRNARSQRAQKGMDLIDYYWLMLMLCNYATELTRSILCHRIGKGSRWEGQISHGVGVTLKFLWFTY